MPINIDIQSTINSFINFYSVVFSAAYIFIRSVNQKSNVKNNFILSAISVIVAAVYAGLTIYDYYFAKIVLYIAFIFAITLFTKKPFKIGLPISLVSLSISQCIRDICIIVVGIIAYFLNISADSLWLGVIIDIIHILATFLIMKIKRLKNGLGFFDDVNNFGMGMLLSGLIFLATQIFANNKDVPNYLYASAFFGVMICGIGLAIWIRSSITRHYKARLQQKSDEHFNSLIAEKDSLIEEVTQSNAFLSKVVHRDNHLVTSLQYSLNECLKYDDRQKQEKILNELLSLANERSELVLKEQAENKVLASTGNSVIDGAMLNMYIKASAHEINFDLIVTADINCLINHTISQTELETLICDHIKDAIIAVDSAKKANGSILVSFAMANGIYEISVLDNGIEFEIDTLQRLGTERVTTHKESGGSGIGFMTSFETLKKAQASLIITEFNSDKPFSKSVAFRFDGCNKFIIKSYRHKLLKQTLNRTDITILRNN